jgi:hypothetical protein
MVLQAPPEATAFLTAPLIGLTLTIVVVLLLTVVKRSAGPNSGGPIALTIAVILLISGFWSLWLSPTYETRLYEEKTVRSLSLSPQGSWSETFLIEAGETLEITATPVTTRLADGGIVEVPTKPALPTFNAEIYGPGGELLWSQTATDHLYYLMPEPAPSPGTLHIQFTNPHNQTLTLTLRITDRSKTTIRPLEPLGQWLTLISLPLFGLGAWLSRRPPGH